MARASQLILTAEPTLPPLAVPMGTSPDRPLESDWASGRPPAPVAKLTAVPQGQHQQYVQRQQHKHKTTGKGKKVLSMNILGTVKWFNVKKRYGFTTRHNNKEDVFVHETAIEKNDPRKYYLPFPKGDTLGKAVILAASAIQGRKGPQAANVTGPGGVPLQGSKHAPNCKLENYPHCRSPPDTYQGNKTQTKQPSSLIPVLLIPFLSSCGLPASLPFSPFPFHCSYAPFLCTHKFPPWPPFTNPFPRAPSQSRKMVTGRERKESFPKVTIFSLNVNDFYLEFPTGTPPPTLAQSVSQLTTLPQETKNRFPLKKLPPDSVS
uniref:CSD domain-containing protein n=1 Tax=Taeniopygia guttata TaxID=59729 RepID=A0A674GPJ7_TAEGU